MSGIYTVCGLTLSGSHFSIFTLLLFHILAAPGLRNTSGVESSWKKTGKNRKLKSKRVKTQDSSESTGSGGPVSHRPPLVGLNATAWSPSDTSQSSCPSAPFPASVPAYPLPVFQAPGIVSTPGTLVAPPAAAHSGFTMPVVPVGAHPDFTVQPLPFAAPLAPVMAFMLPSYPFPPATPNLPQAFFPSQPHFPAHPTLASEMAPASQAEFPGRTSMLRQPCTCPVTPPAGTVASGRASPPLFQSRGSSPLQLNLLQLEEAPESSIGATGTLGTPGTAASGLDCTAGTSRDRQPKTPPTVRIPGGASFLPGARLYHMVATHTLMSEGFLTECFLPASRPGFRLQCPFCFSGTCDSWL